MAVTKREEAVIMLVIVAVVFVSIFGACAVAVALCHPPFRSWLFAPLRQWIGMDKNGRPRP